MRECRTRGRAKLRATGHVALAQGRRKEGAWLGGRDQTGVLSLGEVCRELLPATDGVKEKVKELRPEPQGTSTCLTCEAEKKTALDTGGGQDSHTEADLPMERSRNWDEPQESVLETSTQVGDVKVQTTQA